jgi:hypothetical protein
MPTIFHGAATSAVEVIANFDEPNRGKNEVERVM